MTNNRSLPSVSVIIPTRDRPRTVTRAVQSALLQSLTPREIIVVDDGSDPPVSPDMWHRDERVRLVTHTAPQGAAAARNTALALATGDVVAFLDDDDVWLPSKLERQVRALAADDKPWGATSYALWEGETDQPLAVVHPPPPAELAGTMLYVCAVATSTVVAERQLVERLGGFPDFDRIEDWLLFGDLAEHSPPSIIREVLVHRTPHRVDPSRQRAAHAAFVEQIRVRSSLLPRGEREALDRHHRFQLAVYDAKAGQREAARKALVGLWLERPSEVRPLLHTVRTIVGERAWDMAKAPARRTSAKKAVRHLAGDRPRDFTVEQQVKDHR